MQKIVTSEVLKTGEIVESLYLPEEEKTLLAVCNKDGEISLHDELSLNGKLYKPFDAESGFLRNGQVLLPSEVSDYSSVSDLLKEIQLFINKYVHLNEIFELIASYYVLLSWVYDKFNELPYLRVLGDYGSGKSRFLQAMGSVCYKTMFLNGGASSAVIFRTIDIFKGTLVLDEADFNSSDTKSDIAKILNCGFAKGMPIMKCEIVKDNFSPASYHVFGPKILGGRASFKDDAIESRCLSSNMERTDRDDIPENLDDDFWTEALVLRNKLVKFRFDNFRKTFDFKVSLDKSIEPRLKQISKPLLSIIEDEEDRNKVIEFIKSYNKRIIQDRGYSFEAEVFRAIMEAREEEEEPTMKDITNKVVEMLDNYKEYNPKAIGYLIRNTFLLETERKSRGFVLLKSKGNDERIVKLRKKFGIDEHMNEMKKDGDSDSAQVMIAREVFGLPQTLGISA